MHDELEDKFRERFSGFESEPEDDFLIKIQAQVSSKSSPYSLNFIPIAVCVSLFILFGINWEQLKKNTSADKLNHKWLNSSTLQTNSSSEKKAIDSEKIKSNATTSFNLEDKNQVVENQIITKENHHYSPTLATKKINQNKKLEELEIIENQSFNSHNLIEKITSKSILPIDASSTKAISIELSTKKNLPAKEKLRLVNNLFISVMPLASYYHIRPNRNDEVLIENIDAGTIISSQRLGWKLQVGSFIPLHKKIMARVGISFAEFHQKWRYTANLPLVGSTNEYQKDQKNYYAGVQVDFLYKLKFKNTFNNYILSGLSWDTTTSQKNQTANLTWQIAYGLSYPIKRDLFIWAEPTFNVSINRYTDENNYVKIRPYQLGINIGANFRIQR